eukprot:TRINITY_DN26944_c1_g1_i1.p2 TRINITY_DN26944_c1_g1~~TRINITY_DN26944_c1_g1_i1.p2  ORF type:complete len:198 (-),score=-16.42 TRINITY_DN26944_c1_g1_i1:236-829(-)
MGHQNDEQTMSVGRFAGRVWQIQSNIICMRQYCFFTCMHAYLVNLILYCSHFLILYSFELQPFNLNTGGKCIIYLHVVGSVFLNSCMYKTWLNKDNFLFIYMSWAGSLHACMYTLFYSCYNKNTDIIHLVIINLVYACIFIEIVGMMYQNLMMVLYMCICMHVLDDEYIHIFDVMMCCQLLFGSYHGINFFLPIFLC